MPQGHIPGLSVALLPLHTHVQGAGHVQRQVLSACEGVQPCRSMCVLRQTLCCAACVCPDRS